MNSLHFRNQLVLRYCANCQTPSIGLSVWFWSFLSLVLLLVYATLFRIIGHIP